MNEEKKYNLRYRIIQEGDIKVTARNKKEAIEYANEVLYEYQGNEQTELHTFISAKVKQNY